MRCSFCKSIDTREHSPPVIAVMSLIAAALSGMTLVALLGRPIPLLNHMVYGLVGLAILYDVVSLQANCKRWDIHMPTPVAEPRA